ncbi:DUF3466 family protein [Vibrio maerlii]|uniref:DUF3466 family protein n=1 Tax=Vibrio maerlii TaxID=2231648 RepID=UPI000E3C9DA7|nr:DUF3466 family protein [Vibrio maerlii]
MSHSSFKLTLLAAGIVAATSANAAIYDVHEVDAADYVASTENYGVAIQKPVPLVGTGGCFETDCGTGSAYAIAVETRNTEEAISYREEVPFAMDLSFSYVDDVNNSDDLEAYCFNERGYDTCEDWAKRKYVTWSKEYSDFTAYENAIAYVNGKVGTSATNTVVNGFVGISSTPFGNYSNTGAWAVGFGGGDFDLEPQSRVWFNDGTNIGGSISSKVSDGDKPYLYNSSKAALQYSGDLISLNWGRYDGDVSEEEDDRLAQGSIRAIQDVGGIIYAVGFNTYRDQRSTNDIAATVFSIDPSAKDYTVASNWTYTRVSGTENEISSDYTHSNSVVTDLNANLVAIGEAKRQGNAPENGAANNRLFYIADVSGSKTASFFSGGIFFNGAGGTAAAINNYNEVVGQIDAETSREVDGKQRRTRGYINPLNANNTEPTRRAIFNNQAWLLDDLTNDGSTTSNNNQYRIVSASDINDDGVIAATAIKCTGGYDTTSHNAYCGGGNQDETVVAVKLVPKIDDGSSDFTITARSTETPPVERSGGSLGFALLTVLGFLSFRRK